MPKLRILKRRMTHYAGPFFMILVISLITTMVAIGYYSVINTTREALRMTEEMEKKEREAMVTTPAPTEEPGTHLMDYNSELYEKSLRIFGLHNSTVGPWFLYSHSDDLVICSQPVTAETKLVLLTTMPYSSLKGFIFNNTITNWSQLKPHVLPVLYIAKRDILEKSGILIHQACSLGWVVAVAPTIIKSGFPMLRHLLSYTASRWKSPWYGFSNGDILFTEKLVTTLTSVSTDPCLQRVEFLTAQRRNAIIPAEKVLTSFEEVEALAKQSELAYPNAIDLFIYKESSILLYDMPDFVAGRRGFDNWLLYHVLDMGVPLLDITHVTPVVHQGIEGLTFWANSHQAILEDDSFNIGLAVGNWWYERGHLWCVPYMMHPYNTAHEPENTTTYLTAMEDKLAQAKFLSQMFDTNIYVFIRYFFSNTELRAISDWRQKAGALEHQYYRFRNRGGDGSVEKYMLVRRKDIPANCWGNQQIQLSHAFKRTPMSKAFYTTLVFVVSCLMPVL